MFAKDTHILAVDDSVNIRRIMVSSLKQLGYSKVTTSENATEAFGKLQQFANTANKIGLVLSDLNMPGPSGLDFLRQVRSQPGFSSLPFILVTAESEKEAVIDAAMSGATGYVVKPFEIETLRQKMLDAWSKSQAEAK